MKCLLTFFAVVVLAVSGFGQGAGVSLTLGTVDFRLGMSKQQVASLLPDNYSLIDESAGADFQWYSKGERKRLPETVPDGAKLWVCSCSGNNATSPGDFRGEVEFKHGKLVYASRHWDEVENTTEATLGAVVNALKAISKENNKCSVVAGEMTKPDGENTHVWIICGDRTAYIGRGSFLSNSKRYPVVFIDESIGDE